jgi:hypothetical protein
MWERHSKMAEKRAAQSLTSRKGLRPGPRCLYSVSDSDEAMYEPR